MKRMMLLLLAALLAALPFFSGVSEADASPADEPVMEIDGETNYYIPWVTMDTLLDNAGSVWSDGTFLHSVSAAQSQGFLAMELQPEDAYQTLKNAYDADQGAGVAELLKDWGLWGYLPEGYPVRHVVTSEGPSANAAGKILPKIEIISYSGWGWGEECSLIFVEDGTWRLVDCMDAEFAGIRQFDGQDALFLEFQTIGHGTGYYVRDIDVYNLKTRRVEASYTVEGHDIFQYWGVQSNGAACYAQDGLHIFRRLSLLEYDQASDDFLPAGSLVDVFDYALDENGSLVFLE